MSPSTNRGAICCDSQRGCRDPSRLIFGEQFDRLIVAPAHPRNRKLLFIVVTDHKAASNG
jgi:hypothetical protein